MNQADLIRELSKIHTVLQKADEHFTHEGHMNAALHMSDTVHPSPLAAAVTRSKSDLYELLIRLQGEPISPD